MSVEIAVSDEACAMGTMANVVVMVWRGPPTDARLAAGFDVVLPLAQRCGTKVGVITVIEQGAPSPEPRQRVPFMREVERHAHVFAGLAMVFEGAGPWSSATLDVATAMLSVLGRPKHPIKLCVGTREASAWLSLRAREARSGAPSRDELCHAIEQVRAAIGRATIDQES